MNAFLADGSLDQSNFDENALGVIVDALQQARDEALSEQCGTAHLLLGLWPTLAGNQAWLEAFDAARVGSDPMDDLRDLIVIFAKTAEKERNLDLKRESFSPDAIAALEGCDAIRDEEGQALWEGVGPVGILPLWVSVLQQLDRHAPADRLKRFLDFGGAAREFLRLLLGDRDAPTDGIELFSESGDLRLDGFDDGAVAVLETARDRAGGYGDDLIRPHHLFVGLLERAEGVTEQVIRLQGRPDVGPSKVLQTLVNATSHGPMADSKRLDLSKIHISETLQTVLHHAAADWTRNRRPDGDNHGIGECFLLRATIQQERDGIIGSCLRTAGLEFDIDKMLHDLGQLIRRGETGESVTAFVLPVPAVKSEDLTYLARTGKLQRSVGQNELVEQMLRGLHKRKNSNVLISGEAGIGKTELVREFSRRVAEGTVPFLKRKKVVLVNCDGVPPDQSRDVFTKIVASIRGRNDIILCLDHFENILQYSGGHEAHNRAIVRVALRNRDIQLVAVIENRYLMELMSHDNALMELFTRVAVREVDPQEAQKLLTDVAVPALESLYGVKVEPEAIRRSVVSSHEFIMSERLPVKAIKMLREACERVGYDKDVRGRTDNHVRDEHVVEAIAAFTGIESETIAGAGTDVKFDKLLAARVVAQEQAVETVSTRLDLIKAGEVAEGKPAAVFFFAGLTGTGKTELAKAIAQVYSASKKLSVYPMSNFTEAHSISGILGVPAGYVGHDTGGRLINDLNADPYGVILFDEAEKAHPEIWRSMLSLFDEAWIEDRRNVKAYGNRAIFILTSNAGQEFIRKNINMDLDQLKDEVRRRLVDYVDPQHGWHVFTPEFLGRFTDIIIFSPLSEAGMRGIADLRVKQLIQEWKRRRNKDLIVDREVIDHIAAHSYRENEEHGGTLGGRVTAQYVDRKIRHQLTDLIKERRGEYREAASIHVSLDGEDRIAVRIASKLGLPPGEAMSRALLDLQDVDVPAARDWAATVADRLGRVVEIWSGRVQGTVKSSALDPVRKAAEEAQHNVIEKAEELSRALDSGRQDIAGRIQAATPAKEVGMGTDSQT